MSRPPGVVERVRALQADERHVKNSDRLRQALVALVTASAKQGYADHPLQSDLDLYDEVAVWAGDPQQRRSGGEVERRRAAYLHHLGVAVSNARSIPLWPRSFDDLEQLRVTVLDLVRATILGDPSADFFELLCWNEANGVLDGATTPYRAASNISHAAIHEPRDPDGLLGPLAAARIAYEDEPARRPELNAAIRARLTDYVARAPWPVADTPR